MSNKNAVLSEAFMSGLAWMRANPDAPIKEWKEAAEEFSRASSSRAEVERDAARYRWLRDSDRIGDDGDDHIIVGAAGGEDVLWGERMDSAIDADMLAAAEAPNAEGDEE